MNVEQLQYICAVAECDSITAAAKKLYVTQQTISKAVAKLERELGVQLLNRDRKGISLTESGELFVLKANKILVELEDLYSINPLLCDDEDFCGAATIYCSNYFTYRVAPKLITYFSDRYPNVQLHFVELLAKDALSLLLEKDRLGFITTIEDFPSVSQTAGGIAQFKTITVYDDQIMLLCCTSHPLAQQDQVDLKDLADYALLLSSNPGIEDFFAKQYKMKLNVLIYSANMLSSIEVIRAGSGIGLITHSTIANSNLPNDVAIIPIAQKPSAKSHFVYLKNHELTPLEREVVKQSSRILSNF